jgi:hypothetical protein
MEEKYELKPSMIAMLCEHTAGSRMNMRQAARRVGRPMYVHSATLTLTPFGPSIGAYTSPLEFTDCATDLWIYEHLKREVFLISFYFVFGQGSAILFCFLVVSSCFCCGFQMCILCIQTHAMHVQMAAMQLPSLYSNFTHPSFQPVFNCPVVSVD